MSEQIPASRKLQRQDAQEILAQASEMTVAKGKKVQAFKGGKNVAEDALDAMLGSTGNLRAPCLIVGKKVLVGFNEAAYDAVFT